MEPCFIALGLKMVSLPPTHIKAFCTPQPPRQIGLKYVKYISFRRRMKTDIKANKILYSILEKVTV